MSAGARILWADMVIGKTTAMKNLMREIEQLQALIRADLETEIEEMKE
jgi:hypothetical protein